MNARPDVQLPPRAPYSRPTPVLTIIRRNREKGLPEPITVANLERIGIGAASGGPALQALKFVKLVNEAGGRTEPFEKMRRVSEDEYRAILAGVLQTAYKDVFDLVDPEHDDLTDIDNAFRQYEPAAQRERMVALFMELCREAGIVLPEETGQKKVLVRRPQMAQHKASKPRNKGADSATSGGGGAGIDTGVGLVRPDYVVLSAMFQKLPKDGKWTETERNRWLTAFEVNLDFSVEVVNDSPPEEEE